MSKYFWNLQRSWLHIWNFFKSQWQCVIIEKCVFALVVVFSNHWSQLMTVNILEFLQTIVHQWWTIHNLLNYSAISVINVDYQQNNLNVDRDFEFLMDEISSDDEDLDHVIRPNRYRLSEDHRDVRHRSIQRRPAPCHQDYLKKQITKRNGPETSWGLRSVKRTIFETSASTTVAFTVRVISLLHWRNKIIRDREQIRRHHCRNR